MSLSILRIKRKRNGEALDALVIEDNEPLTKRSKSVQTSSTPSSRGLFRFAETVPLDSFDTDNKTRLLRDRISAFLQHPPHSLARVSSSSQLRSSSNSPTVPSSPARKLPSSSLRSTNNATGTQSPKARLQDRVDGFHQQSKRSRYRIIEQRREEEITAWEMKRGPMPPTVRASTDMQPNQSLFKIYDAVEEGNSRAHILPSSTGHGDEATDQFVSMLEEYLSLQDKAPSLPAVSLESSATVPIDATARSLPVTLDDEDDSDFVYDVYYRDLTAVLPVAGEGGSDDVSSAKGLQRIGELAGLQDDEQILSVEMDSEEEDEADQDSNEENDYRNDYPDEDEDDDDSFSEAEDSEDD